MEESAYGCKGKIYTDGAQWLKPQAKLKQVVVGRAIKSFV